MIPWQPIADQWLGSKTVAGVHLHWISAEHCSYTLCVLEKHKQVISVVTKKADIPESRKFGWLSESGSTHTLDH